MGRRGRHSAKTGDGGAERRLAKKLDQQRNNKTKNFAKTDNDLVFHDDPSDNDDQAEDAGSSDEDDGSEQELMQLNDDTEDEQESDLEERDDLDDEDIDEEAFAEEKQRAAKLKDQWGSSKKQFYSADTADYEMDSDMEDIAKDEEDAALELQRKQAELMDEDDFEVATVADTAVPDEDEEGRVEDELADIPLVYDQDDAASTIEAVQKDFSKLSKKDKLAFVQQSSPELLGLLDELQLYLAQYTENIRPAIEKLEIKSRFSKSDQVTTGLAYMKAKEALVLNYTTNISFYLHCKAQGKSMVDHPVLGHILNLQDKLRTCDQIDQPLDHQLDALLNEEVPEGGVASDGEAEENDDDDGLGRFFEDRPEEPSSKQDAKTKSKKRKNEQTAAATTVDEAEAEAFYNEVARTKKNRKAVKEEFYTHEPKIVEPEFDEDGDDDDKKRGATYQMIKNKGLKAHKSKINRNPRVKKRLQYKKALVRRKGQVREVRTGEAARYGGEMTGIKANITRSRKL
ncbi:hypothetical protein H310_05702 [Aphanomyces invadans]|uniref:Sas10 C-terminal domain-containing protein n=1 Tax=Aphanomyces invadans TaxID=157072 RepID=A0A024U747_9STRA|nr:hypothetical protein H310_05702 [Aphanomyces invadans]ETW02099.1 hypothetical protein H310_05702 [Aphanomyces invadans]|eukprot:XP_008868704.1 hypothetical protein H310_05702 [Aphanomyces invadans]